MQLLSGLVLAFVVLLTGGDSAWIKQDALRAFIILYVRDQGYLLMESNKPNKGSHFQLPGGRIDPEDFDILGVSRNFKHLELQSLVRVGKRAAMRELREETQVDLRPHYERLEFLPQVTKLVAKHKHKHATLKKSHLPRKLYYYLEVNSTEFSESNISLSHEHVGHSIQPNLPTAIEATVLHSGGDSARALTYYMRQMEISSHE